MTKTYIGALPVVRIRTNEPVCSKAPEELCRAFVSCDDCPFEDSKKRAGVMLIIEREPDHEKN